jgi:hypothetical protein
MCVARSIDRRLDFDRVGSRRRRSRCRGAVAHALPSGGDRRAWWRRREHARRAHRAGLDAQVVCTDDFASWDHPLEWWRRLIEQVLEPLSRDEPGRFQRYDCDARQLAEWREVPVAPLLILEGVSSSRAAFGPYLAFRVWVSASRQERLRRGLERDRQTRWGDEGALSAGGSGSDNARARRRSKVARDSRELVSGQVV